MDELLKDLLEITIEKILEREPIRFIDGRYSDGFVDTALLVDVIESGKAEIYKNETVLFVRLTKP
jgi:hypothetical protein